MIAKILQKNSFSPSDGRASVFRCGAIAPSSHPLAPPLNSSGHRILILCFFVAEHRKVASTVEKLENIATKINGIMSTFCSMTPYKHDFLTSVKLTGWQIRGCFEFF